MIYREGGRGIRNRPDWFSHDARKKRKKKAREKYI
jgi:hypothetical protein